MAVYHRDAMSWADYLRVSSIVHDITEGIRRSSYAVVGAVDAIVVR